MPNRPFVVIIGHATKKSYLLPYKDYRPSIVWHELLSVIPLVSLLLGMELVCSDLPVLFRQGIPRILWIDSFPARGDSPSWARPVGRAVLWHASRRLKGRAG